MAAVEFSPLDRALSLPRSPDAPAETHVEYPRMPNGLPYKDDGESFSRYWNRVSGEEAVTLALGAKFLGIVPQSFFAHYVKRVGDDAPRPAVGRVRFDAAVREDVTSAHVREFGSACCGVCRCEDAPLHIDHKVPLARGGTNDLRNLWLLCEGCNLSKGAQTVPEFVARRAQAEASRA